MSRVQDTLHKVVDAGWYGSDVEQSEFMCHALRRAVAEEVITHKQGETAGIAIRHYMHELSSVSSVMSWALYNAGLLESGNAKQWASIAGKEFYRNWDDRPRKAVSRAIQQPT